MSHPAFLKNQVLNFEGHGWKVLGMRGTYVMLERDDGEVREMARVFVATCLERAKGPGEG